MKPITTFILTTLFATSLVGTPLQSGSPTHAPHSAHTIDKSSRWITSDDTPRDHPSWKTEKRKIEDDYKRDCVPFNCRDFCNQAVEDWVWHGWDSYDKYRKTKSQRICLDHCNVNVDPHDGFTYGLMPSECEDEKLLTSDSDVLDFYGED